MYAQWYNKNKYRSYPLREDANKIFTFNTLSLELPNDILIDLKFNLGYSKYKRIEDGCNSYYERNEVEYKLKKINVSLPDTTFEIYSKDEYKAYFIAPTNNLLQTVYVKNAATDAVIGSAVVNHLLSLPFGAWESEDTFLENRTWANNPYTRVTSIHINGIEVEGKIKLTNGYNLEIKDIGNNTLEISAALGYGEGEYCFEGIEEDNTIIYGINGVVPDESGNININTQGMMAIDDGVIHTIIKEDEDNHNICYRDVWCGEGEKGPQGPKGPMGERGTPCDPKECINKKCIHYPPGRDMDFEFDNTPPNCAE